MKTLTKHLFKIAVLIIIISFATNCKQDDFINELEDVQEIIEEPNGMSIETQKVNIDEVSGLSDYIALLGRTTQNRNNGSNIVVTPFGNIPLEDITEAIDTLGNANYTFVILPSIHRTNKFFNLVVHQAPDEEDFSSFVMEYDLDNIYAEDYFNENVDLSEFHGTMRSYSSEEFLAFTGNEGSRAPCGEDTGASSEPCNEAEVDNSDGPASNDGTGDGSGVGDSNNGDPVGDEDPNGDGSVGGGGSNGASRPCWATLYIVNCGGSNSSQGHPLSSCQGPQNLPNEEVYFVNSCGPGVQRTSYRDIVGCPIGGGAVAVSPVPFADLGMALGLTEDENACLGSNVNCDLKNEIYSFLNLNITSNGSNWEQDALDFAGLVVDELVDDCEWDFEVDYNLEIIYEITETAAFQAQTCLKEIKDDVVATSQISRVIKKFKPTNPVLHLEWGMFSSSDWANTGHTGLDDTQTLAFININSESLSHVSNIVMVQTIIHEVIHAELYRKLKELVDDYSILSLQEYNALQDNYSGIADFTNRYGNLEYSEDLMGNLVTWGLTPNFSEAHHNQMADFYRETFIEAMKAYDLSKNITRPNSNQFYEAMSWIGLRASSENGTTKYYDAWQKFKDSIDISEANIPEGNRTYDIYNGIINQEFNSTGINCN